MEHKALFITCEGGEGAGKTTLIGKLRNALAKKGYQVLLTREPGSTALGENIRQLLLNGKSSMAPNAELLLFLAARAQNIEQCIKPALETGQIVLCDRFNDSTIAYQGMARGLGVEKVEQLCQIVCDGLTPDLTFFLDLEPEKGLERASRAGTLDRIESEKILFHQKVRKGLQELAAKYPKRICLLDARQSAEEVFQAAWSRLESLLER